MIFSRGDQEQKQPNSKDDGHDGSGKDKPRSLSTEVGEGDRTLARGDEAQAGGDLDEGDVEGIGVPPEVDDCQQEEIPADNFGSPPESKAKYK